MNTRIKLIDIQLLLRESTLALGLLLFALVLMLAPNTASAIDYTISCEDVSSADTCSIEGEGGFNERLANIVQDIVNVLDASADPLEFCVAGPDPDQYLCDLNDESPPLQLDCTADVVANNGSCQIAGLSSAFFSMDCSEQGAGGTCTVSSDEQAILNEVISIGVPIALQSYATNLLTGCGALGGTDAFRNDCDTLLSAIAAGDNEAVIETLEQVIPANSDNAIDGTFYIVGAQLSHISNRLSRLRQGNRGTDISAVQFFDGQQWLSAGQLMAANNEASPQQTMNDASPARPSDNFSRAGFFVDGSLVISEQEASEKENSSDVDSQLLTLGIDYRFRNDLVGGLAFSYAATTTDYGSDRGKLDNLGFLLMAYGSYFRDNWYVDASVGLGGDDYEQTRRLVCDASCVQAFDQSAESKFNGDQTTLMLSSGYNWHREAWTISPFLQLASITVDIDNYRETMSDPNGPGAGFALDIDDHLLLPLRLLINKKFKLF